MSNLPFVTLNVAMTLDGKTDTTKRQGALISSDLDMERVDRLRASNDAIVVGGHTLLGDDPRLTIKTPSLQTERISRGLEPNPKKVGIITIADLKPECRFLTYGPAEIIIFTTNQTKAGKISELQDRGVKVFVNNGIRVDLMRAFEQLTQLGVENLLIEGGGTLNEELFRLNLINEVNVYIGPLIFGGANAPTFASSVGFERDKAKKLELRSVQQYDDGGLVLRYTLLN
jgi:2,5-diamino-6-(ribosylamino)-4(3H)-pyrimidinone 5'-phosphate reductase